MVKRATISNNAAAPLIDAIAASGLTEGTNYRYDGITLEGTLEQWAALAEATIALYADAVGSEKNVLRAALRRNPAMTALVAGFSDYRWHTKRMAIRARRAARKQAL
ncbi:MAG: hypothetical protein ACPHP1_08500 [Miltoncostaeaceae bacterium]